MAEGTSKVLKAQTVAHPVKKLPAHNGKGKKHVVNSDNRPAAVTAATVVPVFIPAVSHIQHSNTVILDNSDHDETAKEGDRGYVAEIAAIRKIGTSSTSKFI